MLTTLMQLYVMMLAYDERGVIPHLVGPPGCGKSSVVEELADLLGVELHIVNVSRISPLDVEGVQMPVGSGDEMVLRMLPATFWTSLKEGDILLLDEFLRGFPEVYNALLDVFTSRRVGAFRLPKVFIVGASNSVESYDRALDDRLDHIKVPDPRKSSSEKARLGKLIVDQLGLLPEMAGSQEMMDLLNKEVLPTYNLLDSFTKKGVKVTGDIHEGHSVRNLLAQARLRHISSTPLKEMLDANNARAMSTSKIQYALVYRFDKQAAHYANKAEGLVGNPRLTPLQALNLKMNLELIQLEMAKRETEEE